MLKPAINISFCGTANRLSCVKCGKYKFRYDLAFVMFCHAVWVLFDPFSWSSVHKRRHSRNQHSLHSWLWAMISAWGQWTENSWFCNHHCNSFHSLAWWLQTHSFVSITPRALITCSSHSSKCGYLELPSNIELLYVLIFVFAPYLRHRYHT